MFVVVIMSLLPLCLCSDVYHGDTSRRDDHTVKSCWTVLQTSPVNVMRLPGYLKANPETTNSPTSKGKRSLRTPVHLAKIFKKAYKNRNLGLSGDVIYVAKKVCHADFILRRRSFRGKDIRKVELNVYKKPLKKTRHLQKKKIVHAIVSIHQVRGKFESKLIDSRIVRVDASGWITFDVTAAFVRWTECKKCNKGVDIWVESLKTGKTAAKIARRFRFVGVRSKIVDHVPTLAVFFRKTVKHEQNGGVS